MESLQLNESRLRDGSCSSGSGNGSFRFGSSQEHLSASHTQLTADSLSGSLSGSLHSQLPAQPLRQSCSAGSMASALSPEMKLRMQKLLRQNAGVLKQDSNSILHTAASLQPETTSVSCRELDKRFSAVAIEMLREQEDRDLHPYGRGGRFEGVLYSRRVKVQVDHAKFLAWIVFAGFILLTSAAIIFLAEMERRQKTEQQQQQFLLATATQTPALLATAANSSSGAP